MSNIPIGIDLGTTYSAVAAIDEEGIPHLLSNAEGKYITPSVIFFEDEHNIVVGEVAKDARVDVPDQVAEFIKRSMGTDRKFNYIGQEFTPIGLSGLILKKLKTDAEAALGKPVTKVVITCPAYFGAERRDATEKAAEIAGLEVLALINEPTAAAISFGMGGDKTGTVLVLDLGGGTFDVTIIRFGDDNQIEVLGSDGDSELGGRDFDDRIIEWVGQQFQNEYGIDIYDNMETMAELRQKAEKAKRDLTSRTSTNITFSASGQRMKLTLSRDEFEQLIQPYLEGMKSTMQDVMDDCNLITADITDVLLVGGSTRVHAVQEMARTFFGKELNTTVHPDEAVALGASLFAGQILAADREELLPPQVRERVRALPSVTDIAPHSIGVTAIDTDTNKSYNSIVLPRGSQLPARVTETFFTAENGQEAVKLDINEGEDENVAYVNQLGDFTLQLPEARPAGSPIEVQIELDLSGIIRVIAIDVQSGQQKDVTINYSANMSEKDVAQQALWLQKQTIK